jgi:Zn-dependent protease
MAFHLGDDTAYLAGRLTLNPLSHLDPIGTLMLFLVHIGWAKPVPVNPYNFRNPRRDLIWVSLAGPGANLLLAFLSGMILRIFMRQHLILDMSAGGILTMMIVYSVLINIVLAIFNLIPIPPLDGSKILGGVLRGELAYRYATLERWGPIIFVILIASGYFLKIPILWWIISPFVRILSILFAGIDLSGM